MIKYEKQTPYLEDIYYEIYDDGFDIYIGDQTHKAYIQREPFIPYHSKSYEENARIMCEHICADLVHTDDGDSIDDRLTTIEANVDYLMLISDNTGE